MTGHDAVGGEGGHDRGRLHGEVAIVTGSTAGLGVAIARRFSNEGARVVVTGRSLARGERVATEIGATFIGADLTAEGGCRHLVEETVRRIGRPTVLVNNAIDPGTGPPDGAVADIDADVWRHMLDIVLIAAATLCQLAVPHMLEAGHGSIVNISSRAAARGTPGTTAYAASKAGLEALARSLTIDYARRGIRCNVVQAGYILHETRDAQITEDRLARYQAMHLTRLPTAADVAAAVLFLASDEAEVISGVTLPVDGGSSAARGRTLG
jgi:NAD(P)-dependent dehydrogenase (short-subunit alcohol dehydrogenase family)